jgi:predicted metal-binding membrane protein
VPEVRVQVRLQRLVGLVALLLASWTWIVLLARDMYGPMTGAAAWMMTLRWDAPHLALLWAMWAVMMTAMMLPAALPLVLLYAKSNRIDDRRGAAPRVYALVGGYLVVWALFSVGAVMLQRLLSRLLLLTPMMEPATPVVGAFVLVVAGIYQLTPLKRVCLQACRSPLSFLMQRWKTGRAGAFRMGLDHGAYCLGCCWALMLILFAGGVMNLAVIVTLTAWVLIEKVTPFGEQSARIAGALLLVTGGWMLIGGP